MVVEPTIEDIYPLSPMQQGMLLHILYAPEAGSNVTLGVVPGERLSLRLTYGGERFAARTIESLLGQLSGLFAELPGLSEPTIAELAERPATLTEAELHQLLLDGRP